MRTIRTLAILFGIHAAAFAQIQDLATTANGEQTYFATSYRQKDSAQAGYLKIFRIAENGLELVKQLNPSFSFPGADPNFVLAEHPSVSADGRVLGFRGCLKSVLAAPRASSPAARKALNCWFYIEPRR